MDDLTTLTNKVFTAVTKATKEHRAGLVGDQAEQVLEHLHCQGDAVRPTVFNRQGGHSNYFWEACEKTGLVAQCTAHTLQD